MLSRSVRWIQMYTTLALWMATRITADYNCLCCYAVEKKVTDSPRTDGQALGYLYEFDCKKIYPLTGLSSQYFAVEFEHKLGYVVADSEVQTQICPGDQAATDTLYSTTKAIPSTSTRPSTGSTATATSGITVTTSTPIKSTTVQPSTRTTTTSPTTSSTTTTHTTPTSTMLTTLKPSTASSTTSTTERSTTILQSSTSSPSTARTTIRTVPSSTSARTTTSQSMSTTRPTKSQTFSTAATTVASISTTETTPNVQNGSISKDSLLRYIGIGYDLLHGNPGGMERNINGEDPGMFLSRRIFQLTVVNDSNTAIEVLTKMENNCTYSNRTNLVFDGKSYQDELLQHVTLKGKHDPVLNDAFLLNSEFEQTRRATEGNFATIYRDTITTCKLGSLSLGDTTTISQEFARDVCNLSQTFDAAQYFRFVDTWGTNVVMAANFGTFNVVRYKTNDQQVFLHLQNLKERQSVLYPSGPYQGYGSSLTVNSTVLENSDYVNSLGVMTMNAAVGTHSKPSPILLSLYPLTEALDPKYWQNVLQDRVFSDVCSDANTTFLQTIAGNIDLALGQYFDYRKNKDNLNVIQHLTASNLQIPLTWPHGFYGLTQTASGCPKGKVAWKFGYRKFDTEDDHAHNYFSPGIQQFLSGSYAANNININFCMKTAVTTDSLYDRHWQNGTYCVYMYGSCPQGFSSGYIIWDDDDGGFFDDNHNAAGGVLPTGDYGVNTKISFCCRQDAPSSTKMYMPREVPFVLLRYGTACQEVHDMEVRELFARWDDEDSHNHDSAGGAHPTDTGGNHDHLLYFCYYSQIKHGSNAVMVG